MRKRILLHGRRYDVLPRTGKRAMGRVRPPGNLAQGIINMSDNIAHTSKTAREHGAELRRDGGRFTSKPSVYYDALKSVNNLVRDARKVQEVLLMVGEVSEIYVTNFRKMLGDASFSAKELDVIATGYAKLMQESNGILQDLRQVINVSTLSMTDKDRMDVVERLPPQYAPLPQPRGLLYKQEHRRELPAREEEGRHRPRDGPLR